LKPRAAAGHIAGFTLLELLVALFVLGALMLALSQGLRFGTQIYDRQARIVNAGSELEATDRALRRLIEQMDPDSPGTAEIEGSGRTLLFTTELPAAAATLPTQTVRALLQVDGAHRLVLWWSPIRHVQLLGPTPRPTGGNVLLERVDHIELTYQTLASQQLVWVTAWKSATPPRLVRIHISFEDGRRWPDIVAAPMRDRAV
jgi:general secretion pathway protein J